MAKPVIVRDLFYEGVYYGFVPADNAGRYWWRQSFKRVANSGYKANIYPIDQGFFGIVRPGKWQDYSRKYAQSIAWNSDAANGWPLYYKSTIGVWIEWKIPDGHNRIHFITRARTTYGIFTVSLGTTSGGTDKNNELDVTSINLATAGPDNDIKELVIATNANSSGEKYLRFTIASAASCYIVGVHSFDTDGIGEPAEILGADGLGMGNDFVDTVSGWWPTHSVVSNTGVSQLLKANTCELTISWKKATEASHKWTSYGWYHFGAGCAEFMATTKTTLYAGGVSQGTMDSTGNIARGELHENERIYLYVKGFGDYDEDHASSPGSLDIMEAEIGTSITANGIGLGVLINWTANASVSSLYVPSIPLLDGSSGKVLFPAAREKIAYIGDAIKDYDVAGATVCQIYPDASPCLIIAESCGPNLNIFEQVDGTKCKQYHTPDIAVLVGGSLPPYGTRWSLGGHISVQSKMYEYARAGLSNFGRLKVFK